jgi:hypothetical protein
MIEIKKDTTTTSLLDVGIELDDDAIDSDDVFSSTEYDRVKTGKTLYILNIGDRTNLLNGYRYIKELLMQYHNFILIILMIY